MFPFRDRVEAGRMLATTLQEYANRDDVVVLALPRGGVPVGFEVAKALHAPLDVFVVRKLGLPEQEELAMGAISSGGVRVLNRDLLRALRIPGRSGGSNNAGTAARTGSPRTRIPRRAFPGRRARQNSN